MGQPTHILKNIIQTLDELLILDFWAIMDKRKPVTILDKDFTKDKEYTADELNELNTIWLRMYDEFFVLKNDGHSHKMLIDYKDELIIVSRVRRAMIIIDTLTWLFSIKEDMNEKQYYELEHVALKEIKESEPKFGINYMLPLTQNIDKIRKGITALENLYNRKKKHVDRNVKAEIKNVYTVVAKVGTILEMQLDVKTMPVTEWIAYEQLAMEKQKAQKEASNKKKSKSVRNGK